MKTETIKVTLTAIIPNGKYGVSFETDSKFKRGIDPSEETNIVNVSNSRALQVLVNTNKQLKRLLLLNSPNDAEMQAIIKFALLGAECEFEVMTLTKGDTTPIDLIKKDDNDKEVLKLNAGEKMPDNHTAILFQLKSITSKIDFDEEDAAEIRQIIAERKKAEMAD